MPLRRSTHRGWTAGEFRDPPPHLIPENGVYQATDCIFNELGSIRKRGGTTKIFTGSQTAVAQSIGAITDPQYGGVYAVGLSASNGTTARFYRLLGNGSLTALTSIGNTQYISRAFEHLGHVLVSVYPVTASGAGGFIKVGGVDGSKADVTTGQSATVTAGNPTITIGGNSNTSYQVGMYVFVVSDSSATTAYMGRITSLPANTGTLTVEPTPTITMTGSGTNVQFLNSIGGGLPTAGPGGKVACSFQNRLVIGNIGNVVSGIVQRFPNQIRWTILPTETPSLYPNISGYTQFYGVSFEDNNFQTIPEIGEIRAIASAGEGNLVIFGPTGAWRLTGELTTQVVGQGGVTWSIRKIPASVGATSERSLQYSPRGILFASDDGVYAFDGAAMRPIMQGRVANVYRDALRSGATIYGSALMGGNHYYLSMSDHGRLVNLDTLAWSRVTNVQISDACPNPSDATRTNAVRWWDRTGAAPSMTNGQVVYLDTMLRPSSSTRTDADGTNVTMQLITRPLDEGDPGLVKRFRDPEIGYVFQNGGSVAVEAAATLDPSAASWRAVGTISANNTDPEPTRLGMQEVVRGAGAAYRFTQSGAADTFELEEIRNRFEAVGTT